MRLKLRLTPVLVAALSAVLMIAYTGYQLAQERAAVIQRAELQTQNYSQILEEHARQTLHRVAAPLEDEHHVIGRAPARTCQHHLHGPRSQVLAAIHGLVHIWRSIHHEGMPTACLCHEAH